MFVSLLISLVSQRYFAWEPFYTQSGSCSSWWWIFKLFLHFSATFSKTPEKSLRVTTFLELPLYLVSNKWCLSIAVSLQRHPKTVTQSKVNPAPIYAAGDKATTGERDYWKPICRVYRRVTWERICWPSGRAVHEHPAPVRKLDWKTYFSLTECRFSWSRFIGTKTFLVLFYKLPVPFSCLIWINFLQFSSSVSCWACLQLKVTGLQVFAN